MNKNYKYKRHGIDVYLTYKNMQVKIFHNVTDFVLDEGNLLIWIYYKVKPIIRKMNYVTNFLCVHTKY